MHDRLGGKKLNNVYAWGMSKILPRVKIVNLEFELRTCVLKKCKISYILAIYNNNKNNNKSVKNITLRIEANFISTVISPYNI